MTYLGHVENGTIVLDDSTTLPDGAKVRVEIVNVPQPASNDAAPRTHFEHYKSIIGIFDDLPSDLAEQHDHYVHGTPKR